MKFCDNPGCPNHVEVPDDTDTLISPLYPDRELIVMRHSRYIQDIGGHIHSRSLCDWCISAVRYIEEFEQWRDTNIETKEG